MDASIIQLQTQGARIRAVRKYLGWSHKRLAEAVHISSGHLYRIERNKATGANVVDRIARILEVNVAWIKYGYPCALPLTSDIEQVFELKYGTRRHC